MRPDDLETTLRDVLREEVATAAPYLAELEERIVDEIGDRLPRPRFVDWLRGLVAPTRTGRVGQLVVLGATAALFLAVGTLVTNDRPFPDSREPSLASRSDHGVEFVVYDPDAESVVVVGDFNAWEPTSLADENGDGIWTAAIPLPPGRYEYAFVIDGRWWGQDPRADEYVKTFGQFSSVLYVGQGGDGA